jgi:hypothetical protein
MKPNGWDQVRTHETARVWVFRLCVRMMSGREYQTFIRVENMRDMLQPMLDYGLPSTREFSLAQLEDAFRTGLARTQLEGSYIGLEDAPDRVTYVLRIANIEYFTMNIVSIETDDQE